MTAAMLPSLFRQWVQLSLVVAFWQVLASGLTMPYPMVSSTCRPRLAGRISPLGLSASTPRSVLAGSVMGRLEPCAAAAHVLTGDTRCSRGYLLYDHAVPILSCSSC